MRYIYLIEFCNVRYQRLTHSKCNNMLYVNMLLLNHLTPGNKVYINLLVYIFVSQSMCHVYPRKSETVAFFKKIKYLTSMTLKYSEWPPKADKWGEHFPKYCSSTKLGLQWDLVCWKSLASLPLRVEMVKNRLHVG